MYTNHSACDPVSWLFSLSIINSLELPPGCHGCHQEALFWGSVLQAEGAAPLSHPLAAGQLGCFMVGAITNKAVLNIYGFA